MDIEAKELINWRALSTILTGNPETVRTDRGHRNREKPIEELTSFINYWITKHQKK